MDCYAFQFCGIRRGTLMAIDSPPLDQVVAAMLGMLDDYLPPPVDSIPAPSVSAVSITERSVGLGGRRGMEMRDAFPLIALKGIRLDTVVRFQSWAANPNDAETAMMDLTARLMADRDFLRTSGIFKLALEASPPADPIDSLSAWRKTADFRVLFEFHYEDTDGAESLIARIPIAADPEVRNSPERETTIVTDEMVRWDNEATATLIVRGPIRVKGLSALAFISAAAPSGTITLTRTFDGATGAPTSHPALSTFLSAITRPNAPEDHALVTFASLTDFLAAFTTAGDPVTLGVADSYQARVLNIEPAILLSRVTDRLEIAYQNTSFDQVAVVYLRLKRG